MEEAEFGNYKSFADHMSSTGYSELSIRAADGVRDGSHSQAEHVCYASFTLVIPAFNEESALTSTLKRCLDARSEIMARNGIPEVRIVLVNDGSTDATRQIAEEHPEIIKIHFQSNRGYGAALKAGFQATDADVLGFMDADGTCDPFFCAELIDALLTQEVDMAVGSRMNDRSQMPLVRWLGNSIFAGLVGTVSGKKSTDCASGMRVFRRSLLRKLHPLPDGLHFTPAMTCLALLHPQLKIVEVPMPYGSRVGQSKLRVVRDGFKFLFTILFTAALFNPIKSLAVFGVLFLIFGFTICAAAAAFDPSRLSLLVWCAAFITAFFQAVFIGFLAHQAMYILLGPSRLIGFESLGQHFICTRRLIYAGITMLLLGLTMFFTSVFLSPPWHTIVAVFGSLCVVCAGWSALAGVILRVIWTASERRNAERDDPFAPAAK
jgi:glycosyltransferase involved in cell wall biosynthesis